MSDRWNNERERWWSGQARRGRGADPHPDDAAAIYQERSFLPPGQADFSRYGEGGYDDRRSYQSQGGYSPPQPHAQAWEPQRYTQGDYTRRREEQQSFADRTSYGRGARGAGDWGRGGPSHDRVFGERETGTDYTQDPRGFGPRGYGAQDQEYGPGGYQRPQGGYDRADAGRGGYGGRSGDRGYGESYGQGGYGYDRRDQGGPEWDAQYGRQGRPDERAGWGRHRVAQGPYANTGHSNEPLSQYPPSAYEPGRYGEPFGGRYGGYGEGAGQSYAGGAYQSHRGRGPKGYQRTDARIREDVIERLTDDHWLDASDIDVTVIGGEVALNGHVENREAKRHAERLVEDLGGVKHVQNNLRVRSGFSQAYPNTGAAQGAVGNSVLAAQTDGEAGDRDHEHRQLNLTAGGGGASPPAPGRSGGTVHEITGSTTGAGHDGDATGSIAASAHAQSAEGRSTAPNSPGKRMDPLGDIEPKH